MGADIAEQYRLLAKGHEQDSTAASLQAGLPGGGERNSLRQIGDVDKALASQQSIVGGAGVCTIRLAQHFAVALRHAVCRDRKETLAVIGDQGAAIDAAQTMRLVQNRGEHRREVAGRGVDDLQYLSGGG